MVERVNRQEFGKEIRAWYRVWYIKESVSPTGEDVFTLKELFVYATGEPDALRQTKRWKSWEGIPHKHIEQLDHVQKQLFIDEVSTQGGLFYRSLEQAQKLGVAGEAVHMNPDKSYLKVRLSEVIRAKIQVKNNA